MKTTDFGRDNVAKILFHLAPPVMLASLIQALYNICDSFFVGRYSDGGLTALSIVYPFQLLMLALAVGTGVGINTVMAARQGVGEKEESEKFAGISAPLLLSMWFVFALVSFLILPWFASVSTDSPEIAADVVTYGRIVCVFSPGLFLESGWTKVCQANGDMKTPMLAQILGAVTNIALDPILIFGLFGIPKMNIAGAAVATVIGQTVAALVVVKKGYRKSPAPHENPKRIKAVIRSGMPNILMQSAYTVYILGLNFILKTFSDQAVTVLGLYYKWQSFFIIPLTAMQTCIVPIISYNYAARNIKRCRDTLKFALIFGVGLMFIGIFAFELFPDALLSAFSSDALVVEIGTPAFRIIGTSFVPIVLSLTFPVFFQAVGLNFKSSMLTVLRTVVCFVPIAWAFSRIGLDYFWLTFPVTEIITTALAFWYYGKFIKNPYP